MNFSSEAEALDFIARLVIRALDGKDKDSDEAAPAPMERPLHDVRHVHQGRRPGKAAATARLAQARPVATRATKAASPSVER